MIKLTSSRKIIEMCQSGDAKQAKKLLLNYLSSTPSLTDTQTKRLLDDLLQVELYLSNADGALQALRKRRAMGYQNSGQRMDAALQFATLLSRTGLFVEARAELTAVLLDKRSLKWSGLLEATFRYVEVDERCRERMSGSLAEAATAAINHFGIHIAVGQLSRKQVASTIKAAHHMYHTEALKYSELLRRALTIGTRDDCEQLTGDIRTYVEGSTVEFFRGQAQNLLAKFAEAERS